MSQTVYIVATPHDAPILARLNRELIEDEGHRNEMNLTELEQRVSGWLSHGEYQAVLFTREGLTAGYALFRREEDAVYLRQFLVCRAFRREGVGMEAMAWLRKNVWTDAKRIRLDVLIGNSAAMAFYRAAGFEAYAMTMELENE